MMTKEQAADAIKLISYDHEIPSWAAFKLRVMNILDQIDPEPQEFSVRELGELVAVAQTVVHVRVYEPSGLVIARVDEADIDCDCIDELKAKLIELAKPPKPKTVAVELPIDWVKGYMLMYPDGIVGQSMRSAMEKLEQ